MTYYVQKYPSYISDLLCFFEHDLYIICLVCCVYKGVSIKYVTTEEKQALEKRQKKGKQLLISLSYSTSAHLLFNGCNTGKKCFERKRKWQCLPLLATTRKQGKGFMYFYFFPPHLPSHILCIYLERLSWNSTAHMAVAPQIWPWKRTIFSEFNFRFSLFNGILHDVIISFHQAGRSCLGAYIVYNLSSKQT